jgi:hypothetical protein
MIPVNRGSSYPGAARGNPAQPHHLPEAQRELTENAHQKKTRRASGPGAKAFREGWPGGSGYHPPWARLIAWTDGNMMDERRCDDSGRYRHTAINRYRGPRQATITLRYQEASGIRRGARGTVIRRQNETDC